MYTSDTTMEFYGDYETNIRRVELMYHTGNIREYYQPYYCFYIFMEETGEYARFYVPAVQGATISEIPPEPEPKIICIDGYELLASSMFYKDGKYFTVENSKLIEIDKNQAIVKNTIGETWVEHTANGSLTFFEYGDSEVLLLDNVMSGKAYHTLDAMYIDGKILIIAIEAVGGDYTSQMTTCYVYSQENGSLTQMIEPTPSEGNASVLHGLTFYGGRYKANFSIASASYKDEKLYVQSRSDGVFVFVISEFE